MKLTKGILAILVAKSGKEKALADFLSAGREIAVKENGTVTWYAFQINENTFGIFDTFASDGDRQAHIDGLIPKELGKVANELLAKDMDLKLLDLIATK